MSQLVASHWRHRAQAQSHKNELSGVEVIASTFASRWQRGPALVLKHLLRKHEWELVELHGWWQTDRVHGPRQRVRWQVAAVERHAATGSMGLGMVDSRDSC